MKLTEPPLATVSTNVSASAATTPGEGLKATISTSGGHAGSLPQAAAFG